MQKIISSCGIWFELFVSDAYRFVGNVSQVMALQETYGGTYALNNSEKGMEFYVWEGNPKQFSAPLNYEDVLDIIFY